MTSVLLPRVLAHERVVTGRRVVVLPVMVIRPLADQIIARPAVLLNVLLPGASLKSLRYKSVRFAWNIDVVPLPFSQFSVVLLVK